MSRRFHFALAAGLALAGVLSGCSDATDAAVPVLAPSDVTFAVALGSTTDFRATTTGAHGELVPRAYFDRVEPLTRVDEPDDLYDHLDVVAVRLDPCFFEGTGEIVCSPQVRLVFQPVFEDDGGPTSRDATIHAFYAVPQSDVRQLADDLARLRTDIGGPTRIDTHPAPEAAADLVLAHVGAARLTRITFVSVHASDEAWTFGGFDLVNGDIHAIIPPGTHDAEQHLTSVGGERILDATILPVPAVESEAALWLSAIERQEMSASTAESALEGLRRLADPIAHNPGTVDCASCHMASTGMYHAGLDLPGPPISDVYRNTQNQRMLGFFGRDLSVSPRVRAETDAVLRVLETL